MFGWVLAAYLAGQTTDVGTTIYALQRPGFQEGNTLLGSGVPRIVLTKAGVGVVTVVAASRWKKEHPRLAFCLLAGGAAVGTYATVHNVQELRRAK